MVKYNQVHNAQSFATHLVAQVLKHCCQVEKKKKGEVVHCFNQTNITWMHITYFSQKDWNFEIRLLFSANLKALVLAQCLIDRWVGGASLLSETHQDTFAFTLQKQSSYMQFCIHQRIVWVITKHFGWCLCYNAKVFFLRKNWSSDTKNFYWETLQNIFISDKCWSFYSS